MIGGFRTTLQGETFTRGDLIDREAVKFIDDSSKQNGANTSVTDYS